MELLMLSFGLLIGGGIISLLFYKKKIIATYIGMATSIFASLFGIISPFLTIKNFSEQTLSLSSYLPIGNITIGLDPLSSFFLLILFIITPVCAIYSVDYMKMYFNKKNIGSYWFFFNILIASLLLVIISRNGVLFLIAWEASAISSFCLVCFEDEKKSVRKAGFIYLIAASIGSAFLIPLFILLSHNNTFNFIDFSNTVLTPGIFICAFFGFGIKAGFIPFHVWLPEAHPAAPSPVSALMSGVMIKLGLYGLFRTMTFMNAIPIHYAYIFIIIGLASGIIGILCALMQTDLKRLLAYSSIENIGVMLLAWGMGLLGVHYQMPLLIILGITGAFLHCFNHAFFKSLLFLGSGAIYHATGTKDINSLGGLLKLMPKTSFCFLIGVLSITAVPAFLGFFSELIIYIAAFQGMMMGFYFCLIGLIGLALISGLTMACFSNVFGTVFLGHTRLKDSSITDVHFLMKFSLMILAISCLLMSWTFPWIMQFFSSVIAQITQMPTEKILFFTQQNLSIPMFNLIITFIVLLAMITLFWGLRQRSQKKAKQTVTWDCGYARPTSRLQYTFSSSVQLLMHNFKFLTKTGSDLWIIKKIFPQKGGGIISKPPDLFDRYIYTPLYNRIHLVAAKLRWVQQGKLNIYILYIFLTLLILFIFKLG